MTTTAVLRTHWDGCYRAEGHQACALAEIERLATRLAFWERTPGSLQPLTRRQRDMLVFLREFIACEEMAPSYQEIANHFDFQSLATVHELLGHLERKGYIRRAFNTPRAIELTPAAR
jgi:hypothetical protein